MKKALSVILSVLVIFSVFSMATVAADDLVTVKFVVDTDGDGEYDVVVKELQTAPGVNFVDRIVKGGDMEVGVPTKPDKDGIRYTFRYWLDANGEKVFTANIPAAKEGETEVIYIADFAEEEIKENQSLWAFIESIFARINMIFEYFAKVFEGIFEF